MEKEKYWFAIYTKPRAEKKVNQRLIEVGISTFFPTVKTLRQWSDRKKIVELPLIPSYLFAKISNSEYETVRRVDGVVNFVYHLGKPAIIRDKEIEAIKNFLGTAKHETIELLPNDKAIVHAGVLTGKSGKIEKVGKNKVILLIEELGTVFKAEIEKSMLKKIQ